MALRVWYPFYIAPALLLSTPKRRPAHGESRPTRDKKRRAAGRQTRRAVACYLLTTSHFLPFFAGFLAAASFTAIWAAASRAIGTRNGEQET